MPQQGHPPVSAPPIYHIASRGSQLALWQARFVQQLLAHEGVESSIKIIKTLGDRIQDRFLHEIGGKGVFVKEIERALAEGQAELAVHSLKDMPASLPRGFRLAAVLARHASGDVIIFHPRHLHITEGHTALSFAQVASWPALTIGTGSLRRTCLLREANRHLKVVPIRGNVDTRLHKLRQGEWDAIILAKASLERLALAQDLKSLTFDPHWFVPSPAQGALAIETLIGEARLSSVLAKLNCSQSEAAVDLERMVLKGLGGDCTLPVGLHAYFKEESSGKSLVLEGVVLNLAGESVRHTASWPVAEGRTAQIMAVEFIQALVAKGVNRLLADLKIAEVSV